MQTPSPENETNNFSSERRPASFFAGNFDSTEMDPDLMFASAAMGGYFQLPDWNNASTMAVRDYEIATPYDDEAERLLLRRSSAVPTERPLVGETVVGDTVVAVAACGTDDGMGESISPRKRRLSTRVGEAFGGFGKAVKRRAGSWGWRRDSVAPLGGSRGRRDDDDDDDEERNIGRSSSLIVTPGSGEESRDGDDEGSGGDEGVLRRRRLVRPGIRGVRRKSTQTGLLSGGNGNVKPAQRRQTLPDPPRSMLAYDNEALERLEEEWQYRNANPPRRLAMMERRMRIAEQQGAFSPKAREKTFKKPHRRLNSECSQQSQASIKLKVKLAKKKSKLDKKFRRAQEGRDAESPISKVFGRLWRRNGRGKEEEVVESDPASELGSSSADSSSGAEESSGSAWSEDSVERLRGLSIHAAVHIGRAVQMAPRPH